MKIVFMGTPEFAVPSLQRLIDDGYEIAAVVTQPDRKSGRGHKLMPPPVKLLAEKHGIRVIQFDKIKSEEGVSALIETKPDVIITAAFGQILSKQILDIPPMGCINVHASLLPKYRGAAPIQWVLINGEKQTGVTIMYMNEGLDTGDIVSSVVMDIDPDCTGGELYATLSQAGASLLSQTLKDIVDGTAKRINQDEAESSYYPPLSKVLGRIDWKKSAPDIHNLVRALDPVMGAHTHIGEEMIKIWRASAADGKADPGQIICADAHNGLVVGTGQGIIRVEEMQAPNGRRMTPAEYFRGKSLNGSAFI